MSLVEHPNQRWAILLVKVEEANITDEPPAPGTLPCPSRAEEGLEGRELGPLTETLGGPVQTGMLYSALSILCQKNQYCSR